MPWRIVGAIIPAAALISMLGARAAYGVPSFARQTGMTCDACHAGGFFPELNNFGRMFKMNGYIWSAHEEKPYEPYPPVAAEQQWSYTHTAKGQPGLTNLPTVHFSTRTNDNFSYPQQANFFLSGRYYGRLGGFINATYDGVDNRWATDTLDIRLTDIRTTGDAKTTVTDGTSPYWRLVLYKNKGDHSVSLGHVGLYDKTFQTGGSGPTNDFLDLGGDVQYQWNSKPHFVTFRGVFIWENQGLSAAREAKAATHAFDDLRTEQFWASYYYYKVAGITLSLFDIAGRRDPLLYAPAAVSGSRNGEPDSWGAFVQLNFLPFSRWLNLSLPVLPMTQFAVQYTAYGKFNGARANYDGSGRRASDNNTLYLLAW